MAPSDVVILLIGLHGTGKTTFAGVATNTDVKTHQGKGGGPCTEECVRYTVAYKEKQVTIIDTPGLADRNTSEENIEILHKIAKQLRSLGQERVSGVIYFHSIEGVRLSAIDLDNIRILKKICGVDFFPRVAFVTTRWDRIKQTEWNALLQPRHQELTKAWNDMMPTGPTFKFLNDDSKSHEEVLEYFAAQTGEPSDAIPQLLFAQELDRYRWEQNPIKAVKRSTAGKEMVARGSNVRKGICAFL
ncbi:P-loop containing nucleoside triphosphate hydrolase protein [Immersiella caudata]|uniref:P-loop containing nucleoside triphosphate hydrolase protein n=1 Tax=Immersiella caudata TaxID=314043 RepID=A0AA39WZ37_9PEZI|nr:P-loop containing nucleoside triphosphate hydrolase protein [Immersiella caudata]